MLTENGREDPRVRRTKRILKETFLQLLHLKGYRRITVKDIVEHADYNRATFYHHYKYKEELANEVVQEKLNGFTTAFREPLTNMNTYSIQRLSPSDIIVFDYIIQNADFFMLYKHSEAIPGSEDQLLQTIIELFQEINNQPVKPVVGHYNSQIIIQAYGLMGLILEWVKSEFSTPPAYLNQQLISILHFQSATTQAKGETIFV
ncbi:TetR/AcrR family transcriptional regulator [Bacillus sp. B15-48]|uniref:TetR/AcrR family transcriptional regulator n=1 Tax=Bacillus sp. B15-48 TaxID=1548601 RepID=UPI00193FACDF|nr:TetR/AcrR family transcriptional regulator [Bacillus sp. B15-48]MBM4760926.1 TetR family transcriptional regulator [Bacillus sp. B15-48]